MRHAVRRFARVWVLLLVTGVAALVVAAPAGAHGATGTLGLEATSPSPTTIRVRALLRYATDGHTVAGAQVVVTADGPGGATAGPLTLADTGDGTYAGELPVATTGTWSVTARAADPGAEARTDVVVTPAPATTPAPTDRPTAPRARDGGTADRSRGSGADADPLTGVAKYLVVVLGVAIVTATLWVGLRRRR